jgi:hypothetical protein
MRIVLKKPTDCSTDSRDEKIMLERIPETDDEPVPSDPAQND